MRKFVCVALLLVGWNPGIAMVTVTSEIVDVAPYVDNHTWVVFDLDNTLIRTSQQLGSPQWVRHLLDQYVGEGVSRGEAVVRVLRRWAQVHRLTRVQLVDTRTVALLSALQDGSVPVLCLSGRLPRFSDITERQLESVGIDLSKTAPSQVKVFEELPGNPEYRLGVLHIGVRTTKGQALEALFEALNRWPRRLIFVDDDREVLIDIDERLEALQIESVCIHYEGAKPFVEAFDPYLAQRQWEYLGRVLSDTEVLRLEESNG